MANMDIVSKFVRNNVCTERRGKPDPDAIPRMHRMLYRSITNINIKDSSYNDYTVLHYQVHYGTTGSVAWLLRQDPPPDINERTCSQWTPLMFAVYSGSEDPEGKVRLLLDHGADRDLKSSSGHTALDYARWNKKSAVIDMLENYRSDVRGKIYTN
jgi:ankyrin repeat protein